MGNRVILVQSYFMILHAWLIHQRLVLEGSKAGPKVLARQRQSKHWNILEPSLPQHPDSENGMDCCIP